MNSAQLCHSPSVPSGVGLAGRFQPLRPPKERILFGQLASAALQCNDLPPPPGRTGGGRGRPPGREEHLDPLGVEKGVQLVTHLFYCNLFNGIM